MYGLTCKVEWNYSVYKEQKLTFCSILNLYAARNLGDLKGSVDSSQNWLNKGGNDTSLVSGLTSLDSGQSRNVILHTIALHVSINARINEQVYE
jgi:hypothetical protein